MIRGGHQPEGGDTPPLPTTGSGVKPAAESGHLSNLQVLSFFRSAIQSGAGWTPTCQSEFAGAYARIVADRLKVDVMIAALRRAKTDLEAAKIVIESYKNDTAHGIVQTLNIIDDALPKAAA